MPTRAPVSAIHRLRPWLGWISPLARRDLGLREKRECLVFYASAYGQSRLFATLPRSGYNYLALMLHVALDLSRGGSGTYRYVDGAWRAGVDVQRDFTWAAPIERARVGSLPQPVMFHTHLPYEAQVNARRSRMRVIVVVRNLVDQLESALFHASYTAAEQSAFLASGAVEASIEFCNSWGAYVRRRPDTLVLRYEELIADPLAAIRILAAYWRLDLSDASLQEAVVRCSRPAMLAQIPAEEQAGNPRVSVRPTRGVFSPEHLDQLRRVCRARLEHSFAYRYDPPDPQPEPTHASATHG
jgi:hypothetical protein